MSLTMLLAILLPMLLANDGDTRIMVWTQWTLRLIEELERGACERKI